MRIAIYHNQPSGGARRALYEIGARLAARHEVDVFTLSTADETFLASRDFARRVVVEPFAQRRPVRMGLYLNEANRLRDLRMLEQVCRRVAAQIDAGGYDVAWLDVCRFVGAPSVAVYLAAPSAYYCHEPPRRFVDAACRPDPRLMTRYERARLWWHRPGTWLYDTVAARLDQRNVRAAGMVLTNSAHTARNIQHYYGVEAVVCPLGVDTARFYPVEHADPGDYVLSVGAIEPHKGHDFIIRSLGLLPSSIRPRLVIAGNTDGGQGGYLRRVAARAGVQVDLLTGVPHDDLVRLYQRARAFVFAAHQEPFGLVVLEAMACGLPVVAVAEGGPVESMIDGTTGLLVPRDEATFAQALARVLGDAPLARSMGREGRRMAETAWTWQAASDRAEAQLAVLAGHGTQGAAGRMAVPAMRREP
jgi:glycosyltransferase involved in cell wall biosynthesis